MRIDAYNQVTQMYQTGQGKTASVKEKKSASDKLEISQAGKDFRTAKDAVKTAPDIREDRVNAIRQQMLSGTYNVSAEEVAGRMAESYFNSTI